MKHIAVTLITVYQKTLSPDHGWMKYRYPYGYCRHYPSCSEYTKQAFLHNSILRASWLSSKRILRCNPFVAPQVDLSYKKDHI